MSVYGRYDLKRNLVHFQIEDGLKEAIRNCVIEYRKTENSSEFQDNISFAIHDVLDEYDYLDYEEVINQVVILKSIFDCEKARFIVKGRRIADYFISYLDDETIYRYNKYGLDFTVNKLIEESNSPVDTTEMATGATGVKGYSNRREYAEKRSLGEKLYEKIKAEKKNKGD